MIYTDVERTADLLSDIQIKIEVLEDISRTNRTNVFGNRLSELYEQEYQLSKKLYN